jgi:FMN reductase
MRPLFAYLRALTLPTSVFAAPEDWATAELGARIQRAATEAAVMLDTGVGHRIADRAWSGYQHQFGGNATRAQRTAADVDFTSPLMRLAAGGTTSPRPGRLEGGDRDDPRHTTIAAPVDT